MSAVPALRVALIGAGRMARTHAPVLASLAEVRVTRVHDPDRTAAAALAAPFGAAVDAELEPCLEAADVDAVLITTPTATHAELVARAAAAGRHVFVEKPVAHDLAAADRVVTAVARAGTLCQVGFQRRYDPAYVEARRRIEAGELGRLEGFRAVSRDPHPPVTEFLRTSGGLMVDLGIHDLDSARFLVGEVEEVRAYGAVQAVPELARWGLHDAAVAILRFEDGALGTLELGLRTAWGHEVRAEVLGERGRLVLEQDARLPLAHYDAGGRRVDRPRGFGERFREAYAEEIRAFARAVAAGGPVAPDAADARASLRLALAAQRALESGEAVRVRDWEETP